MNKIKGLIKLLRIKHYIKNILIFVPLVFSGNALNIQYFSNCVLGFFAFSLISSCIYILNDIRDIEKDKLHPTKKYRPLASGEISIPSGIITCFLCSILAVIITCYLFFIKNVNCFILVYLLIYFVLNLFYSFGLKNIPILDIVILMSGFLIRVLYGARLVNTFVSSWLYLTVISGAFYFGLGKRRNEFKYSNGKNTTRGVLSFYNFDFLDKFMYICLTMTIVFYALWAKEYENPYVIWSVPIVIVICMKYSLDIEGNSDGDPVEVIFKDRLLLFVCIILLVFLISILYIPRIM